MNITSRDIAAARGNGLRELRRPESQLVKAVLQYLDMRGIFAWRCNSGGVRANYHGKERFFRFNSAPGMSDIIGVVSPLGRVLAVECKVAPNKATADQANFLLRVRSQGGIGVIAYTVDDVEAALNGEVKPIGGSQ